MTRQCEVGCTDVHRCEPCMLVSDPRLPPCWRCHSSLLRSHLTRGRYYAIMYSGTSKMSTPTRTSRMMTQRVVQWSVRSWRTVMTVPLWAPELAMTLALILPTKPAGLELELALELELELVVAAVLRAVSMDKTLRLVSPSPQASRVTYTAWLHEHRCQSWWAGSIVSCCSKTTWSLTLSPGLAVRCAASPARSTLAGISQAQLLPVACMLVNSVFSYIHMRVCGNGRLMERF